MRIDMVALCRQLDLASLLGQVLSQRHPHIRVLRPEDVEDPAAIRHALVFRPGPEDFAPYPNLEFVCTGAAGVDGILGNPGLTPRMTVVRTVSRQQGEMMAAFAAYYVTGWTRRMWDYPGRQAERVFKWINITGPRAFPVGVLGYGNMGATVAKALSAMGYPVTALARAPRDDGEVRIVAGHEGLMEIARSSKVVINILPLTPETRGILNAAFFAAMDEEAMLVQVGRGGHLVEADLLTGLARGRPARAAIDVFETEPPAPDHPFWAHPQIMVTPHIASFPPRDEAADWLAGAIAQYERGERPQGAVDLSRGY